MITQSATEVFPFFGVRPL